jgi:uncharacterized YigZ family protein
MSAFSFKTLQSNAEGIYKEKGSRFHAFAFPVESAVEIKEKIDALKKEYFDARHHCYAWMLGPDKKEFRAFDDGEPNHSAGDPILGQIRSKNLTNVLVVVVRYFGGVKLGVGGLITAYKSAAENALDNAVIIEREVIELIRILFDYTATPDVMRLVKEFDLKIRQQDFDERCLLEAELATKHREKFITKVNLMIAMGLSLKLDDPPIPK